MAPTSGPSPSARLPHATPCSSTSPIDARSMSPTTCAPADHSHPSAACLLMAHQYDSERERREYGASPPAAVASGHAARARHGRPPPRASEPPPAHAGGAGYAAACPGPPATCYLLPTTCYLLPHPTHHATHAQCRPGRRPCRRGARGMHAAAAPAQRPLRLWRVPPRAVKREWAQPFNQSKSSLRANPSRVALRCNARRPCNPRNCCVAPLDSPSRPVPRIPARAPSHLSSPRPIASLRPRRSPCRSRSSPRSSTR